MSALLALLTADSNASRQLLGVFLSTDKPLTLSHLPLQQMGRALRDQQAAPWVPLSRDRGLKTLPSCLPYRAVGIPQRLRGATVLY